MPKPTRKVSNRRSPAKAAGKSTVTRTAQPTAKTQQKTDAPIIGQWPFAGALPTPNMEMFTMTKQNPFQNPFANMPQFDMNQMMSGMMPDMGAMPTMGMPDMTKSMQDMQTMWQDCMAAQKKSAEAMQTRWDSVVKTASTKAQNMNTRSQKAAKDMMSCKTFTEFAEAQKQLMQDQMEDVMSTASYMSETCTKMIQDVAEPMTEQMTKMMSKMNKSAA